MSTLYPVASLIELAQRVNQERRFVEEWITRDRLLKDRISEMSEFLTILNLFLFSPRTGATAFALIGQCFQGQSHSTAISLAIRCRLALGGKSWKSYSDALMGFLLWKLE